MQSVFTFENAKTVKGESLGYITAIRYLAPSDESGRWNVCPRREIERADKKARLAGMKLAVRVNGTSDLPGDAFELARAFPHVQFYDYTKIVPTTLKELPPNYHVTLSYDAQTVPESVCLVALKRGVNVAVVFSTRKGEPLPETHWGHRVIDGDEHDLRFLDPRGVVVGLRAKGLAKKMQTGFVVEV